MKKVIRLSVLVLTLSGWTLNPAFAAGQTYENREEHKTSETGADETLGSLKAKSPIQKDEEDLEAQTSDKKALEKVEQKIRADEARRLHEDITVNK